MASIMGPRRHAKKKLADWRPLDNYQRRGGLFAQCELLGMDRACSEAHLSGGRDRMGGMQQAGRSLFAQPPMLARGELFIKLGLPFDRPIL
jgi:hypothetical protein